MTKRSLHRLTAKKVENEKTPGRYADGGGLYLQVGPTGTKSWLYRFMIDGRAREMGLGSLQVISLAEARNRAQEASGLVQDGIDPLTSRTAERAQQRLDEAKGKLFRDCAADYIAAHRSAWRNAKHVKQWESTLKAHCYPDSPAAPAWRDLPVSKIDTGLVMGVLDPIWRTKTETASRLRGRIESILDWATVRGYRDGTPNPARWKGHLDKLLPKRSKVAKVQHHPALPFDELPAFMKELRKLEGTAPRALEFIILTATRTGETIGAEPGELDIKAASWSIPGSRMKSGRDHKVPLSPPALAIAKDMKGATKSDYLFPGLKRGKPLSNMACLKVLERMKRTDLTVHGFRSTFRDWAAERTNFPREVVEMALAHVIPDKTEAAYRRGDLFEKRRKLIEQWAQFCSKPSSGTVHQLSSKKS